MMIEIFPCQYSDITDAPHSPEMLAEYARESAIDGLGEANPQREIYERMQAAGMMFSFGAYAGETIVGFIAVLVSVLPHFGKKVATIESFFVMEEYRKSRAGLSLLRQAENLATEEGAVGIMVCAPVGSRLDRIMSALPYRETNKTFFKELV